MQIFIEIKNNLFIECGKYYYFIPMCDTPHSCTIPHLLETIQRYTDAGKKEAPETTGSVLVHHAPTADCPQPFSFRMRGDPPVLSDFLTSDDLHKKPPQWMIPHLLPYGYDRDNQLIPKARRFMAGDSILPMSEGTLENPKVWFAWLDGLPTSDVVINVCYVRNGRYYTFKIKSGGRISCARRAPESACSQHLPSLLRVLDALRERKVLETHDKEE
jgi:hypothetical protein